MNIHTQTFPKEAPVISKVDETKLYEITATADIDYKGVRYCDVKLLIHRVGNREWSMEQKQLCTDSSSMEWVERHLFTAEEATDIVRKLDQVNVQENPISEIVVSKVILPVDGLFMAADAIGYDVGEDSLLLAQNPEWDGPEVKAYFSVRGIDPDNFHKDFATIF